MDKQIFLPPVVCYLRKSTDAQDESRQESNIKDFLSREQITVNAGNWFSDTGGRFKAHKREDFQRLLQLIRLGQVKTVIVSELDRWGTRDIDQYFEFRQTLLKHDCRLWSVKDGDLTSKDFASILTMLVKVETSTGEIKTKSHRTITKRLQTATSGEVGRDGRKPPFGYDKVCMEGKEEVWRLHYASRTLVSRTEKVCMDQTKDERKIKRQFSHYQTDRVQIFPDGSRKVWSGKDLPPKTSDQRFEFVLSIDEKRIECVRLAYNLYDNGSSCRGVAHKLNALGFRYFDTLWISKTIADMLRNPSYMGEFASNQFAGYESAYEIVGEGKSREIAERKGRKDRFRKTRDQWISHKSRLPAIVSVDQWERVNARLNTGKADLPARNEAYYLKGLVYCGQCGKRMAAKMRRGKPFLYCETYHNCQRAGVTPTCGYNSIAHEEVDAFVRKHVKEAEKRLVSRAENDHLTSLLGMWQEAEEKTNEACATRLVELCKVLCREFKLPDCHELPPAIRLENTVRQMERKGHSEEDTWLGLNLADAVWTRRHQEQAAELAKEHARITSLWCDATPLMQATLKDKLLTIETLKAEAEQQSTSLADQIDQFRSEAAAASARLGAALDAIDGDDGFARRQRLAEIIERVELVLLPGKGRQARQIDENSSKIRAKVMGSFGTSVFTVVSKVYQNRKPPKMPPNPTSRQARRAIA